MPATIRDACAAQRSREIPRLDPMPSRPRADRPRKTVEDRLDDARDLAEAVERPAEALEHIVHEGPIERRIVIGNRLAVGGATFVLESPTVAIAGAGGLTDQSTVTISGTVTEAMESQVVGSTVTLTDNGATVLGTATVQAGVAGVDGGLPTGTANVTLSGDGTHSIVASDTDTSALTGASSALVVTLATMALSGG